MKLSRYDHSLVNNAHSLKLEIACLFILKVILITIIWFCFFPTLGASPQCSHCYRSFVGKYGALAVRLGLLF